MNLEQKMEESFLSIRNYSEEAGKQFERLVENEPIPLEIQALLYQKPKRVGYIISTCCPCTKAHLELVEQAIETLHLDLVLFVVWPFHYIPDFHAEPLDPWVKKNKYLPWKERMELLEEALKCHANPKIRALHVSQEWYIQSEKMFSSEEKMSAFWTGTWFVIRKLQHFFRAADLATEFYFCCGEDQYNPNIYALRTPAQEKVWKDYCILQHLALHHVFVVPRDPKKGLEKISVPSWSRHQIYMGELLSCGDLSATQVRNYCNEKILQTTCNSGAAHFILQKKYWESPDNANADVYAPRPS